MQETTDPRKFHAQLIKTANNDRFQFNNLITSYSKSNRLSDALRVFHHIPFPNIVSWTALISAHADSFSSFHHFISMLRHPTLPNERTLTSLFKTCASLSSLRIGLQLHSLSLKLSLASLPFTGSALVNFYSKCHLPRDACEAFYEIPEKDEVCYAAIIVGLAQNSRPARALYLFAEMKSNGIGSTMYSVSCALRATAELASLEECRIIHGHAVVTGFDSNVVVGSSLIDGYGKSGIVSDARRVFDGMLSSVNIIAWNALMSAYAQQGDTNSVNELFNQMRQMGVFPDEFSFLALLTACSNAGLVIEAEQWLNYMSLEFGVEPGLEHYTCVVSALARAGRLEDANHLLKAMPFKPDAAVCRALLSSSAVHGNPEMASEMSKKLLEKNLQDDSAYAILANAHAAAKSWDEVADVRKIMKVRGVSKESGRSWIEVRGEVHEFFSGDKGHNRTAEIYDILEEVMNVMAILHLKEHEVCTKMM